MSHARSEKRKRKESDDEYIPSDYESESDDEISEIEDDKNSGIKRLRQSQTSQSEVKVLQDKLTAMTQERDQARAETKQVLADAALAVSDKNAAIAKLQQAEADRDSIYREMNQLKFEKAQLTKELKTYREKDSFFNYAIRPSYLAQSSRLFNQAKLGTSHYPQDCLDLLATPSPSQRIE